MGELVLRQARTEQPQGRHGEADADISNKSNLLWPHRDHLSCSFTIFPQDPFELNTSVSQMCNHMFDTSPFSCDCLSCCWFQSFDLACRWWTHIHLSEGTHNSLWSQMSQSFSREHLMKCCRREQGMYPSGTCSGYVAHHSSDAGCCVFWVSIYPYFLLGGNVGVLGAKGTEKPVFSYHTHSWPSKICP